MRRIYYYGYGGWSEILDVRNVGGWLGTAIVCVGSDGQVRTHCTPLPTNMLAFHVPKGHPIQWASSPEGQRESAEALRELLRRFPTIPKHLLTTNRIVARLTTRPA